jgi:type IV pilus assembly protein PilV
MNNTTLHRHGIIPQQLKAQRGVMLLEALAAILIFSVGILAVVGLQAASIKQATSAEFRSIAALQANDLISRMWASDHTAATLQANYVGPTSAGSGYSSWLTAVQGSGLPGISSASSTLPNVTFTTVAGGTSGSTSSTLAKITMYWVQPGDNNTHTYVVTAQIK